MHCFAVYTIECAATIPKLRFILILIVFQTRREGSRASPPETSGSEWSAFAVALETSNVYSVNKIDVLSRDAFIFYGPFKFIRMTRDISVGWENVPYWTENSCIWAFMKALKFLHSSSQTEILRTKWTTRFIILLLYAASLHFLKNESFNSTFY